MTILFATLERRMRVLVVEDHEELAETVATGLRREGMAVDVALDGTVALQRAAVYGYDVIVLDRDIPGVHGDGVCQALIERGGRARPDADGVRRDRGSGRGAQPRRRRLPAEGVGVIVAERERGPLERRELG